MFFFWGVFRGKRNSCLQKVPVSPKRTAGSRDTCTAIMTSLVDKDLPTCNKAGKVISDVHSLIYLQCLPSTEKMNGNSDGKAVSHFQQSDCVNSTEEQQVYRLDCNSMPPDQMKPQQSLQDTRSVTNLLVMLLFQSVWLTLTKHNTFF